MREDNVIHLYEDELYEQINAYLRGGMSADEERTFIDKLSTDDDMRQKAVAIARLTVEMDKSGQEKDRAVIESLKRLSADDVRQLAEKATGRIVKRSGIRYIKLLSVACSAIAAVWIGYLSYGRYTTIMLGEEYATAIAETGYMRGGDGADNAETTLKPLFSNVASGDDIGNTIRKLDRLWQWSLSEEYNDYTDYAPEIGWNLSIAYLKDNDRANAAATLERLVEISEPGSLVNKKAKELLQKVK